MYGEQSEEFVCRKRKGGPSDSPIYLRLTGLRGQNTSFQSGSFPKPLSQDLDQKFEGASAHKNWADQNVAGNIFIDNTHSKYL